MGATTTPDYKAVVRQFYKVLAFRIQEAQIANLLSAPDIFADKAISLTQAYVDILLRFSHQKSIETCFSDPDYLFQVRKLAMDINDLSTNLAAGILSHREFREGVKEAVHRVLSALNPAATAVAA